MTPQQLERKRARERAYYAKNREKELAACKRYYQANKEKHSAGVAAYDEAHPEQRRLRNQSWRHKVRSGKVSSDIVQTLLAQQGGKCVYCQADLQQGYHIDHRIPLALDGKHEDDNIQLLCPPCNMKKGKKHPDQFEKEIGYERTIR